jgi:hypothetical protein
MNNNKKHTSINDLIDELKFVQNVTEVKLLKIFYEETQTIQKTDAIKELCFEYKKY